jgi:hypothetical protein
MADDAAATSDVSDDDLLRLVGEESKRSVGWDNDADLMGDREKALNYFKGYMPDVVAPPNRSQAVSTDLADAIETLLPDLMEILAGGEDVVAFIPQGQEDEEAAQQETDYVQHVVFNENEGWKALYAMIKDALLVKTGLVKFWWEDEEEEEELEAADPMAVMMAQKEGDEIASVEPSDEVPGAYDVTIRRQGGKVRVCAIPPDDFTCAPDTVSLREATYCAIRSRVRAQELVAQGFDAKKIDELPGYGIPNDQINQARDTANESALPNDGGTGPLRLVEVREHYIRVLEGKKTCLYRVLTDATDSVLIDREEVDQVQIAAITPYIVTHRFYGESIADRITEIQKINTVLTRGHLDSMYFSLNQRIAVSEEQSNEFTLSDLLRNEPGIPVRVRGPAGTALAPIQAGGPGFDALSSLEYFQTKAEQRTGIVRAAQGLTPDTLHETARGALALLTQAQKRVRLIARVFAETGLKDLYLGVHALLRKHATQQATVRLRGKWVPVSPTTWGVRSDMTIEIGLGASGKEHELQVLTQLGEQFREIITLQGGLSGPLVTAPNVYNLMKRTIEKAGIKAPETFITDPATVPHQPPKPDPEMMKAQGQMQLEQAKAQGQLQLEHAKSQAQMQVSAQQAQQDAEVTRYKADLDAQIRREQLAQEMQLKREQLTAELQLERELQFAKLEMQREQGMRETAANIATAQVRPGGEPG